MRVRRLLAAGLLLLLLLGGGVLLAVLGDGAGPPRDDAPVPDVVHGDGEPGGERARRHVAGDDVVPGAEVAATVPTPTTTAAAHAESLRPTTAALPAPPTKGPVRIRRDEPSGEEGKGALRISVDDGAGGARQDVVLIVTAAVDGKRGTRFAGPIATESVTIRGCDAGWATLTLRAGSLSRTTRVSVEPGLLTQVDLTLPVGATVTGEVRHREHGLLAGISVEAGTLVRVRNVEGLFHDAIRGAADAHGVYRLTGVPPGPCTLTFKGGPLGYGLQPRTTFDVGRSAEVRHDVLLGTVSLEGVIRDGANRLPVQNAKVTVQSPHYASTTTDAQGRFEFIDLVPGPQGVCVSAEGFGVVFTESRPVLADSATRCDVDLARAVSLVLGLTDETGAPVTSEVIVSFHPKEGTLGTGLSTNLRPDGEGHLSYDKVVCGSYEIAVRDRNGTYTRASVEAVLEPGPNRVDLVLPRSADPNVKLLVEGTVRSAETGAPVAGAEVQAAGRSVTGSDGHFELRGRGDRPPFVYVRCDGWCDERVELPDAGPVQIALQRAAELILNVSGTDGAAFVGYLVLSFDPRDPGGRRLGVGVETDERGTATFRRIPPGRYGVTVGNDVTGRAELEVEIQPGRNEIDVDLR